MVRTPGVSCILKHTEITIISNSKKLTINLEEVHSLELKYARNVPSVYGYFMFKDIQNVLDEVDIKNCTLQVYFNDMYNKSFLRYFKVVDANEGYDKMKIKSYFFTILDEISYTLSNIYISKSFNSSRVSAFKEILSQYKINELISKSNLKLNLTDDNKVENFVVNSNTNLLDFFYDEFSKIGYSFYQNRDSLNVKNFDEILPNKLEEISDEFIQETNNAYYCNMIYELKNKPSNSSVGLSNPKTKTYYFDESQKKMIAIEDSFDDIKNSLSLNNNSISSQQTTGSDVSFQNRFEKNQHINNIRENYLRTFTVEIIINGYIRNDINKIFNIRLQGHKGTLKSQHEGNVMSSGKYVCLELSDKLIKDKLIQKATLGRSDSSK